MDKKQKRDFDWMKLESSLVNNQVHAEIGNASSEIDRNQPYGKITKVLGTGEEATKSLAFFALVGSFIILFLVLLFVFISYWRSEKSKDGLEALAQTIKGIVECFSPIITLIIGYCLGERANTKQ